MGWNIIYSKEFQSNFLLSTLYFNFVPPEIYSRATRVMNFWRQNRNSTWLVPFVPLKNLNFKKCVQKEDNTQTIKLICLNS